MASVWLIEVASQSSTPLLAFLHSALARIPGSPMAAAWTPERVAMLMMREERTAKAFMMVLKQVQVIWFRVVRQSVLLCIIRTYTEL